jgi:stage II sporulation protein R
VIANSDSAGDQAVKLKVRDTVLERVNVILNGENDVDKAASLIRENIPAIEESAESVLLRSGFDYNVKAELGAEEYGTREYESFSLPAGIYNSLRVTIGEGSGKNWWCVVFPPLCLTAAEDFHETAEAAGLSEDEIKLISDEDGKVVFKFKILEIIQKFFDKIK